MRLALGVVLLLSLPIYSLRSPPFTFAASRSARRSSTAAPALASTPPSGTSKTSSRAAGASRNSWAARPAALLGRGRDRARQRHRLLGRLQEADPDRRGALARSRGARRRSGGATDAGQCGHRRDGSRHLQREVRRHRRRQAGPSRRLPPLDLLDRRPAPAASRSPGSLAARSTRAT